MKKPFWTMTAADLMNPVVISLPRQMSLQGAAHLLAQNRITGAPVVDDRGRCIGVLSATDFVHLADRGLDPSAPVSAQPCFCADWQVVGRDANWSGTVESAMSHRPVTSRTNTTIGEVAQRMLEHHIHRLVIVDAEEKPVGVVSTTDLLSAIAQGAVRPSLIHS